MNVRDVANEAENNAADANVGFLHLAAIFNGVAALAAAKLPEARTLAQAGAYWAESLAGEMMQFQTSIGNE